MIHNKIRVLVIEDSLLYQAYLRKVIDADDCLTVVGTAATAAQALALIPQLKPDIITLDMQLPDSDGLALLGEIVKNRKIPVIVVTGDADTCEKAIALGAADFIEKIKDAEAKTAEQFRLLLKLKLKMQAEIRNAPAHRIPPEPMPLRTLDKTPEGIPEKTPERYRSRPAQPQLIALGASLGGTETTLQILRQLPADLPGIVIVQHMPPEFTAAYAMRLSHCCSLDVREAVNGAPVLPGSAIIAKGGRQLTVCRDGSGFRVKIGSSERYGGFCPSVDVLFSSAAEAAGAEALGIILTGMGRDGAEGIKKMHNQGADTLGQDKESCAVFGMPGAAWNAGGLDKLLPPDEIAEEMIRYCSRKRKSEAEK